MQPSSIHYAYFDSSPVNFSKHSIAIESNSNVTHTHTRPPRHYPVNYRIRESNPDRIRSTILRAQCLCVFVCHGGINFHGHGHHTQTNTQTRIAVLHFEKFFVCALITHSKETRTFAYNFLFCLSMFLI